MSSAMEWKSQGNAALKKKDFVKAVECYSKAIEMEPSNHTFYSNRSAAYVYKKDYGTSSFFRRFFVTCSSIIIIIIFFFFFIIITNTTIIIIIIN